MNIIKSLKSKGLYFCLKEATKYLFPIRWISDKHTMDSTIHKLSYKFPDRDLTARKGTVYEYILKN